MADATKIGGADATKMGVANARVAYILPPIGYGNCNVDKRFCQRNSNHRYGMLCGRIWKKEYAVMYYDLNDDDYDYDDHESEK